MICKKCKRFFTDGNRPDGIPNGVGFILRTGKKIDICADCMIALGKMDAEQKEKFFEELQEKPQ